MSSIAEFYSRNLANEVMKGNLQKVKGGGSVGRAPIGYSNVRKIAGGREIRDVLHAGDQAGTWSSAPGRLPIEKRFQLRAMSGATRLRRRFQISMRAARDPAAVSIASAPRSENHGTS
jgi:hypothetical protein